MERNNIIILRKPASEDSPEQFECWGSLVDLCNSHEIFSYSYLKSQKYPFSSKGFDFFKIGYKIKTIE